MFTLKRNNWAHESMLVNAAEILHWVPVALDDPSTQVPAEEQKSPIDTLMESLSSGVILCRLIERCSPASSWPAGSERPQADVTAKYNPQAKPGSFQARDNISNFITACKSLGIPEVTLFSSEDLVSRKNDKLVINCLLQLARAGASNGVKPPQIIQYELDIENHKKDIANTEAQDSDDEEQEELVPEQYGLTEEQLRALQQVFNSVDQTTTRILPRKDFVKAIHESDAIKALAQGNEGFAKKLEVLASEDSTPVELGEFLSWWGSLKKKEKIEAKKEDLELLPPAARPRGLSKAVHEKLESKYLPYVPKQGDSIDEALAEEVNANNLDIRIAKIFMKKKKKVVEGAYRIGTGAQPIVFMRLVRNLLMVRDGNNWESVVRFIQRKMAEEAY